MQKNRILRINKKLPYFENKSLPYPYRTFLPFSQKYLYF